MASAMSGGTSYSLKTTHPVSGMNVILYLYVVRVSQDKSARVSNLSLGMYVKTENGAIGPWTDDDISSDPDRDGKGSELAGVAFDGGIPNFTGTHWLVSNIPMTVTHDTNGDAVARIPWRWGVHSTWGKFTNPSGIYEIDLPNIGSAYVSCGSPSSLNISDNQDNTLTFSCTVGTDGNLNRAYGVRFFLTCDGSDPNPTNYLYSRDLVGSANESVSTIIPFSTLSSSITENIFDESYSGNIKVSAITKGYVSSFYYSELSEIVTTPFVWHSRVKTPTFITPEGNYTVTGKLGSYKVSWEQGISGINNPIKHYILKMFNAETGELVNTYTTSNLYYSISNSAFTLGNTYYFSLTAIGEHETLSGEERCSGNLYINTISRLSTPKLSISDGLTVPKIWADTFVDIGSGDIASISWTTPTGTNNIVESYSISISYKIDGGSTMYSLLSTTNLGNVNNFCINSDLLQDIVFSKSCTLTCQLRTNSIYGSSYSSKTTSIDLKITRGCGIYTKVISGYSQPIMKRAIAFAKVAVKKAYQALVDKNDVLLLDSAGLPLYVETDTLTNAASWAPMKEFYLKNSQGQWQLSDIKYEVLTDINGEIITDANGDPIYML